MNRKITCIQCPLGCQIKIDEKNNNLQFSGNVCLKGEEYAIKEIKNPTRILTTTILVRNGKQSLLPVRSEKGMHKDLIKKCIYILSKESVKAPIKHKDIIYKNILNTKINIIASRDIDEI
jgi:CxxC motif-containing protein